MKHYLLIPALALAMATSSAFANSDFDNVEKNNHETGIGFGAGSMAGGLVAGPLGFVTGAFIGSLIGENTANEANIKHLSHTNSQLENKLSEKSTKFEELEENSSRQSLVLNDAHHTIEKLLIQNQELRIHALNFDIQFRTNSSNIEKKYQQYLNDFANTLNANPNIEIEVAGFSDRTGDENYNLDLSIKRASQVKEYLVKQGIKEDRIITLAHGESQPLHPEENLENNFFDRRVTVYLRPIEISSENIASEISTLEREISVANK